MFEKVLVALDGSELAERALGSALTIAERFGSRLILLRVVVPDEPVLNPLPAGGTYADFGGARLEREREEADGYLFGVRAKLLKAGLNIQTEIITGAPAEMILDVADVDHVDLIVMSTHGRTGLSRLIYGSVAEAVLRASKVPVLLVPAKPQ